MTKTLANKERITTLKGVLQKSMPAIQAVLPKHLTAEKMLRIVVVAATQNPALLECSPLSIAGAVVTASQLGLEPVGPLGQAYLVPFFNKNTGQKEVQLIPGYRGMIELARRSGNILNIEAHVVHERDTFEFTFGLEPTLKHTPYFGNDDPGEVRAVYAIARFRDGGYQYDVMSIGEVNAIRRRSKASSTGPWVTDFEEMARKTVVKRLCKYLPLSVEMATAIAADNAAEAGERQLSALNIELDDSFIEAEASEAGRPKSRTEELARTLGLDEEPAEQEQEQEQEAV